MYGYSWDMMVYNWRHINTIIIVVEPETGQKVYLNTERWSKSNRWAHHADMVNLSGL